MAGRGITTRSMSCIQPIWSTSKAEARSRVIKLYKTWLRQIPHIVEDYQLPQTTRQCHAKLRAEFLKQKHLSDIRQIDTIAMKYQLELKDICCMQKDRSQILAYWANDTIATPQTQFLAKFLVGQN